MDPAAFLEISWAVHREAEAEAAMAVVVAAAAAMKASDERPPSSTETVRPSRPASAGGLLPSP